MSYESDLKSMRDAAELMNFQMRYNQKKARSTWILLGIIGIYFVLEEYFGGSTNLNVLVRMGANVPKLVEEGQWYRLCASVFLHAGYLHVFMNSYVLLALGGFVNRIIGEYRFLVVFFLSGLMGSISSTYATKASVSVGASGAIWGFFGVSVALSMIKNQLIPDILRERLKRITAINLVINIGVSFLPMVDLWAHFGGGVAGLVIGIIIAWRFGGARFDAVRSGVFRILAAMLFSLYLAAILMALVKNKPWLDQFSSPLQTRELAGLPYKIGIPEVLGPQRLPNSTKWAFVFGDLHMDAVAVELDFLPVHIGQGPEEAQRWLNDRRDELIKSPNIDPEIKKSVDVRPGNVGEVLSYSDMSHGVLMYTYIFIHDTYMVKLIIATSSGYAQKIIDSLASKIMGSLESV